MEHKVDKKHHHPHTPEEVDYANKERKQRLREIKEDDDMGFDEDDELYQQVKKFLK